MAVDARLDMLGLDFAAFSDAANLGTGRLPALRTLYARTFREGTFDPSACFDAETSESLAKRFRLTLPEISIGASETGAFGETAKAVARLEGGTVECVRIPSPKGTSTLCVSSQLGCAMGCAFCETGRGGLVRDLSTAEIIGQIVAARTVLGWNCRNVVFMGMGEPLANFDAVAGALGVLMDPNGLAYAQERITICTSGPLGGIERLKSLGYRRLNLSISLNAADDATRSRLMPVNASNGLTQLSAALRAYPSRRNFALGVNYCLIPGVNDRAEDAKGAAAFCAEVGRSLVNVIPYNPGPVPIARAPTEDEIRRFIGLLEEAGAFVRRRATRGRSIMAACGQLGTGGQP